MPVFNAMRRCRLVADPRLQQLLVQLRHPYLLLGFHRLRILDTCRKVASKTHLFFCLSSAPRKNSLPILKQSVARRLNAVNVHELPVNDLQKSDKQNTPVFLPVFSASPLRFDSHHRRSSRHDSTCILHRDHRADRGMSPERKSTHAHAQHTCFLTVFSAIQRCAAHDAAILHLKVTFLVLLHKPLIPAEKKPGRRHTCLLACLSSAPVHCALIHIIGGILGRIASTGSTELIVGCRLKERAHMHMHNTPVFFACLQRHIGSRSEPH